MCGSWFGTFPNEFVIPIGVTWGEEMGLFSLNGKTYLLVRRSEKGSDKWHGVCCEYGLPPRVARAVQEHIKEMDTTVFASTPSWEACVTAVTHHFMLCDYPEQISRLINMM